MQELSEAELADELQELRARASAAEASLQAAEDAAQLQKDKFLRLNADWENYRKRTAAEQTRVRSDAKGDVVKQLLPLVDSFELARSQLQPQNDGEQKIDAAYQVLQPAPRLLSCLQLVMALIVCRSSDALRHKPEAIS